MPLTLAWKDGPCAAITEAALRHYAGMSLRSKGGPSGRVDLVCQLTPRPDGAKVVGPCPCAHHGGSCLWPTPPVGCCESCTLYCLNEPSLIEDPSWIKPGKITFSWWNGDVYNGEREEPILSFAMARKYIDFCARTGIPTHSLTSDEQNVSPWYSNQTPGQHPVRTPTLPVSALISICRPFVSTPKKRTSGSGRGCIRVRCVDASRRHSPRSRRSGGQG